MSTPPTRFLFEGKPVEFSEGESVLIALLRAGKAPAAGGCLCLAGDCPHCLATVDGVSYVRTCQVKALPGMTVVPHPADGDPPLPPENKLAPMVAARHLHCDVAIIGMGPAGQAAAEEARGKGQEVLTFDAAAGQEVIGIYPGPLVAARTSEGMLHVRPRVEMVVATGAAEIQPVAPGNHLAGIVTARAAAKLAAAGIPLGKVVAVGAPPDGVKCEQVTGEIRRFEGQTRVEAVVIADGKGAERRYDCDTVSVSLGLHPRSGLSRMVQGLPVRLIGDAAREPDLPPCPKEGIVCPCSGVSCEDLASVWERGFHELELVKRATLAGTGTCQGSVCIPHLRSFLADKGGKLQPPFTARPVQRQLTIGEAAAGAFHTATPRTALDAEHRRLGAQMERMGGWWRPWNYGRTMEEYWAVREAVSLGDVSTLGKFRVTGPDALELLERLYPTKVASLKPGRSRYVLLLDDRGYVMDDGLVCCDGDGKYSLTVTSSGSTHFELWIRDWAEAWKLDVRILNQTMSLSAINVTGPLASKLLARAGLTEPLSYFANRDVTIAGVPCRAFRLSFTGEISYELHHSAAHSAGLWRSLMELGKNLGIKPHGIEALLKLRLEKGFIIVGQDTDFDSTPRRIAHEWAIKLDKPEFVGRQAILRTNKVPLDKQLSGFETSGPAPAEGALIMHQNQYAGYVTSSTHSPVLGKSVMMGWLKLFDGKLPEEVTIQGAPARRVAMPFYDPEGNRARA